MKKLTITISGHVNTGKSTIAKLIAETLLKHGITVDVTDEKNSAGWPEYQAQRLDALKRAPLLVDIKTVNVLREPLRDPRAAGVWCTGCGHVLLGSESRECIRCGGETVTLLAGCECGGCHPLRK